MNLVIKSAISRLRFPRVPFLHNIDRDVLWAGDACAMQNYPLKKCGTIPTPCRESASAYRHIRDRDGGFDGVRVKKRGLKIYSTMRDWMRCKFLDQTITIGGEILDR